MTEEEFWNLLKTAKRKGDDWDEQLEWLIEKLAAMPVTDIIRFDTHFNRNYHKSYTSDLWAASYIIMGGCSDDTFDYFRAWLLFLGKEPYEEAIQNPQSILPYLAGMEDGDMPQLEELLSCACEAYEVKTGLDQEDYFNVYDRLSGDDSVQPEIEFDWDEDDEEGLSRKFPLLWEAYGEDPMG